MRWSSNLAISKAPDPRSDILIIGDSRAQEWRIPCRCNVVNAGISGQTTTQILLRYQKQIRTFSPRLVLIQAGINDLKAIPLFPSREDEIIRQCMSNLAEMAELAKQQEMTVLLTTIIPTGDVPFERRTVWSDQVDEAVRKVNLFILTLQSNDVNVVDLSSVISDSSGHTAARFRRDFLHLNVTGYSELNKKIRPTLEAEGFLFPN